MKKLIISSMLVAMIGLSVGCGSKPKEATPEKATKVETSVTEMEPAISASKVYNPKEDGIFLRGLITNINKEEKTLTLDSGGTTYTVTLVDETNYAFTTLEELAKDMDVTVRVNYVEDGVTDVTAREIQKENVKSDIEVIELKPAKNN